MVHRTFNNTDAANADSRKSEPDAHGQAAMLLVESLIHGLIAKSVISVADAVEIVGTAAAVQEDMVAECEDAPSAMERSLTLLGAIHTSLSHDLPDDEDEVRPWPPTR